MEYRPLDLKYDLVALELPRWPMEKDESTEISENFEGIEPMTTRNEVLCSTATPHPLLQQAVT